MLDNSGTFNSQWVAPGSDADAVMGGIACTITPGVVPQTLHLDSGTTGCTVEIDDDSDLNGTVDSWDGSGGSTIDVVLTDLDPVSGTVQLTLFDFSENMLTVSGTF